MSYNHRLPLGRGWGVLSYWEKLRYRLQAVLTIPIDVPPLSPTFPHNTPIFPYIPLFHQHSTTHPHIHAKTPLTITPMGFYSIHF